MESYLTTDDARVLAATLPGMTTLLAQTDDALGMLLLAASIDLDASMRFQGAKYDPTQEREFPRLPGGPSRRSDCNLSYGLDSPPPAAPLVWDWDSVNNVAVVPDLVKIACCYQAAWLLDPTHARRLEKIRSGLAAESTGGMSETFNTAALAAGFSGLADRAQRLMERYRLKRGKML
jgi:hypothetical protein